MAQYPNLKVGFRQAKLDFEQMAEISASAIAASETEGAYTATTTVQRFLLADLPKAGGSSNYAWDFTQIGKKVPFAVSVNLKVVNEVNTVIGGPAGGITFGTSDLTGQYVPMPCANPGATTTYDRAYLLVTLASSTFAAQPSGALELMVRMVEMPARTN